MTTVVFLLACLIGVVAGLRTMTAPTAVAWAAHLGWLDLGSGPLAFLGGTWTPWILTALALAEFVVDKLPSTASRTVPAQFGARLVSGALCGAAIGFAAGGFWPGSGSSLLGAGLGIAGAVAGTLGGHAARASMARAFGRDAPAALIEDGVAVAAAVLIVLALH